MHGTVAGRLTRDEYREYLTKKEVAATLGISERTVDKLEADGVLSPFRHGRLVRFPASQVHSLHERNQD